MPIHIVAKTEVPKTKVYRLRVYDKPKVERLDFPMFSTTSIRTHDLAILVAEGILRSFPDWTVEVEEV